MSRSLKVYSGEDQTPVTDITDMVEWPESEFAQRAHLGESTLSNLRFRDEDGRVGNSSGLPAGLTPISLNAHNVVIWTESGATMGRFRISPKDWTRGEQVAGRAREAQVTLEDYNADLRNIVVHAYTRPAETDVARVQGVLASYLSGNPRRTTNLNGSNLVSGSNTVSLPATTYNRTNTAEVLASIAAAANKQYFVTIDAQLFYDGNDSTAYSSPFKISDRDTDLSSTVFAPQPGGFGPASSEDGQQLLSGIWLFYGESQYVTVRNPTVANQNSWWEDVVYDDTVTTAAAATVVANAILAQRQNEERQIAVRIGPLEVGQAILLKVGQLIDIKWRAIPFADDAYVTRRITELRWSTPEPFSFFADMILDRPTKLHGQGQKIDTVIPKGAPTGAPDTAGSAIATWDFNTAVYPDLDNQTGLISAFLTLETNPANCPYGSVQCAYTTASRFNTGHIAVTAGTNYTFSVEIVWREDPNIRNVDVEWYDAPTGGNKIGTTRLITGAGHAGNTNYTEVKQVTAITGAQSAKIVFSAFAGIFVDNMVWGGAGTAAVNDPEALVDPGDSPFFARSDDPRFTNDDQHLTSRVTQRVTNNSGVTLAAGDVVVPDTTLDGPAVTRTTTASSTAGPIGVIVTGGAAAADVVVLWSGYISFVNTNGTPADGDYLFTSTTAGAADRSGTRAVGAFGRIVRDDGVGETLYCLIWGVPDPAAASALTVQEDDVNVDTNVSTLDFTTALNVTSSPAGEANVAVDLGTGATQAAAGNHTHTAGESAKASGTGDITTTTTAADATGATLSLAAGTYIVVAAFDVTRAGGTNDRIFEGVLDVGGTDENDLALWTPLGTVLARAPVTQAWRVVLGSTTTVKLQARHSGGTAGDFTVNGANTTITAFTSGGTLGGWTAYTPTWANGGTTTLGNGTLTGRYKKLDATTYIIQIALTWGSTTSVTGAGAWTFTLPAGLTAATGRNQPLAAHILDSGTDNKLGVGTVASGGTTIDQIIPEGGNTVTGTVPMTWATSDALNINGTIEVV